MIYNETTGRLTALINALDGIGLPDTLTESRALLARAAEVQQQADVQAGHAERTRAELTAQVLDGRMPFDDAVQRLAALAPWLPGDLPDAPALTVADVRTAREWTPGPRRGRALSDTIAAPVVAELHARAMRAAHGDMFATHTAVAALAGKAVARSVAAGRKLLDIPAIAAQLAPPKWTPPPEGSGQYFGDDPSRQHPWESNPPTLPALAFEDIQRDAVKVAAWADATQGHAEWLAAYEVAEILHGAVGGSSTRYAGETDNDAWHFIARGLPVAVHLAVVSALGWKPGLYSSMRPVEPRSLVGRAVDKMAGWATPAQQQGLRSRVLDSLGR